MHPRTREIWDEAKALAGDAAADAARAAGFRSLRDLDHQPTHTKAILAAATLQATATLFGALVEAEMLARLPPTRARQEDG